MMRFITYYRLRYNPFSKESVTTQNAYRSRDFKEMDFRLNNLAETRGIGLFTAPPGAGKTLALRCFMDGLNPNLFKPHYIPLSTVSVAEFYKQWCDLLGVDTKGGKPRMLKNMKEQMLNMYKAKRQPLFLVLDEAQYLSTAILNDLKIILNFECDSLNAVCLALCGEPHLNNTFYKPVHEALCQRITVHYNFQGLQDDEIVEYVKHKILQAGGSTAILEDSALAAIHSQSHGIPRVIDNIMTDALMIGEQHDKQTIDADIVLAAVNNRNLG